MPSDSFDLFSGIQTFRTNCHLLRDTSYISNSTCLRKKKKKKNRFYSLSPIPPSPSVPVLVRKFGVNDDDSHLLFILIISSKNILFPYYLTVGHPHSLLEYSSVLQSEISHLLLPLLTAFAYSLTRQNDFQDAGFDCITNRREDGLSLAFRV